MPTTTPGGYDTAPLAALLARDPRVLDTPDNIDIPDWVPLEAALPRQDCGWFMFMLRDKADDGTQVRLYKHRLTRRYVILDERCRPYIFDPTLTTATHPIGSYVRYPGTLSELIAAAVSDMQYMGEQMSDLYHSAQYTFDRDEAIRLRAR